MRGADEQTGALFSYLSPEAMVPKDHPLRAIRPLVNAALARLSPDFTRLYAPTGRASIAPEKLLRALLLQAFYSSDVVAADDLALIVQTICCRIVRIGKRHVDRRKIARGVPQEPV